MCGCQKERQAREMSRKPPGKEKFKAPPKGTSETIRPPSQRTLYVVLALLTVFFLVGGYLFYHFQEEQMRQRIEGALSIIAQLKTDQIVQWRAERLTDANIIMSSPFLIGGVAKYMASPADTQLRDEVLASLASIGESYPYQDILLVDEDGNLLLSLNESVNLLGDVTLAQLAVAFREHKSVMTDFHYPPNRDYPQMDVVAPLFPWGADSQPVGAVVLCIDPSQYLWPLVQFSPVPSETAETLLVERDGDQVLFLNELRYQEDAALKLRIPLSQQELPAVMAVLGKEEVVEGRDYRGVEVLAALKHIPDSPWYIVSKIDTSETLSAWLFQAGIIVAFVVGLLIAALTATGLIWQRRQRRAYQALYQAEVESKALRRHFEYLVKYANDIIVLSDEDQHIVEANDRALEAYGYGREEILGLPVSALIPPGGFSSYRERMRKLQKEGKIVAETIHQRQDGSTFPVEVSARIIKIEDKQYIQAIARDITERKLVEKEKEVSEARYKELADSITDVFFAMDRDLRYTYWNKASEKLMGIAAEDALGKHLHDIFPDVEGTKAAEKVYLKVLGTGKSRNFVTEYPLNGKRHWFEINAYPTETGISVFVRDITKRKQAEMEYQTIVGTAMDSFAIHDMQGHFLEVNEAYCQLVGYSRDELLDMLFEDVEVIEQAEDRAERIRRMVKETGHDRFEDRLRRKDGGTVDVDISVNYLPTDGGRFFVFLRDITERKQAEEALRQSEERYRSVLEQMEEAYFEVDIDGNFSFFNDATCRQLGYSREELMGMNYRDYTSEEDRQRINKAFRHVYQTGKPVKAFPAVRIRKDGEQLSTETSAFLLWNESGEIIGFRGVASNVTERKQAEEALRRSEQNLRDLIENSPLGIRIADKDGKTIYANRALLDMWGYSSVEEMEAVPREQRYTPDSYDEHRIRVGQRKRGESTLSNYELSIVRSDGQVRILSVSRGELLWGGEKMFQLVYQDITQLKLAAGELEKAVEELQRSNAELERFAYVASHDLQEPLRMVSSYTQLLGRRYKDKLDADANDFIGYAVGGAERMQELLNDLLVYSRVGTRAKPFKRTDMEAVLEAALDNLRVAIKESKTKVSHDPLPTVMADEGQMVQVLQNLIGNAIKFHGEKPPRIHVSAEQRDSEWVFSVKDNGIGIEPQYFDRVFLIFQRLHREEYPGTGTGLAIVKRIVERHGGQNWIESQPGKGSTFYFSMQATAERDERRVKEGKKS
jgi:PAS domain S-box-containing protein